MLYMTDKAGSRLKVGDLVIYASMSTQKTTPKMRYGVITKIVPENGIVDNPNSQPRVLIQGIEGGESITWQEMLKLHRLYISTAPLRRKATLYAPDKILKIEKEQVPRELLKTIAFIQEELKRG